MRPESSIVELREIASGVAIAASVREIESIIGCFRERRRCEFGRVFRERRFELPFGPQIGQGVPAASCTHHVLENAAGSQAAMACEA